MNKWLARQWRENKGILLFLLLIMTFKSSLADWNEVPTGSMKPTIVEGDRILINKIAYDVRIPFTHTSLLKIGDPKRGDIIIFDSEVSDIRLVKRVVGLPGDTVEMHNNKLFVNGLALKYSAATPNEFGLDLTEYFANSEHTIRLKQPGSSLSNFAAIEIPAEMYLALGDNRDNSADSRVIGLVPRSEIIGRTERVVVSLDYENYYSPRAERFWKTL